MLSKARQWFLLLFIILLASVPLAEAASFTISPSNLVTGTITWQLTDLTPSGTGSYAFIAPPAPPPLGGSALHLLSGAGVGTGSGQGGKAGIGTSAFNGLKLNTFTELKYSTYVVAHNNPAINAPYINFFIDLNGDNVVNFAQDLVLSFEPYCVTGSPVTLGTWQQWDPATQAGWWRPAGVNVPGVPNAGCAGATTLSAIHTALQTANANYQIYDRELKPPLGAGIIDELGMMFYVGQRTFGNPPAANAWANHDAFIDQLIINGDVFDLELGGLTIAKSFTPSTITAGNISQLMFTLNNTSGVSLKAVSFTDILPANVVIAPTPNQTGTCTGVISAVAGSDTISLTGGGLPAPLNSSCTISVDVTSSVAGTYTNTSSPVSSAETGSTNIATAVLTVNALPVPPAPPSSGGSSDPGTSVAVVPTFVDSSFISKSVDKSLAAIGDTLTYTVIFKNPKGNTLNNVVIADTVDSRLAVTNATSSLGNVSVSGNSVIVQGFSLLPGQQSTLTITARILDRARAGDVISNTATLESPDASIHISNVAATTILPGSLPSTGESPFSKWRMLFIGILALGCLVSSYRKWQSNQGRSEAYQ